jgi:hypothetical protein
MFAMVGKSTGSLIDLVDLPLFLTGLWHLNGLIKTTQLN